jgi:hypothetical protein
MRIARHVGLSQAAKQIGVRASELTAFERGGEHDLSAEQIADYLAYLEAIPVPEPVAEDSPTEETEPS